MTIWQFRVNDFTQAVNNNLKSKILCLKITIFVSLSNNQE